MEKTLVNKIAESGLVTIRPEAWVSDTPCTEFDLKEYLFHGLILKEQDFRDRLKTIDWSQYKDQVVCVFCSADAIIPSWAYMLVTTYASPFAKAVFFGNKIQWITSELLRHIEQMDIAQYRDKLMVIKGCSDEFPVGPEVYVALTARLVPVVKSLMFGEPCSTVPVYKRPKAIS
jgi:hypothetical protein